MALGDSDETIKVTFVANTQQAIANATQFRALVDSIKLQLVELSKASGLAMKDIATGMRQIAKERFTDVYGKLDVSKFATFNKALSQALREATIETKNFSKATISLGDAFKYAFGAASLIGILAKVVDLFRQGIETGVEFANQVYRLGASTRALQRAGLDITLKEVIQQVEDLRKKFGFFSQKEAVQGVATIQLLTRSFDFSTEQMRQTTEAAVVLSTVTGKDFSETARELALFLSSGYSEAMQRAGLAVNRLRVAEEAQAMGINKGYTALTEQERAAAGLQLVLRELAPISEEVAKYQESLAGRIATTNAEIETLTNTISLQMAPLKKVWLDFKLWGIEALYDVYAFIIKLFSNDLTAKLYGVFVGPLVGLAAAITAIRKGADLSVKDVLKIMKDAGKEMEEVWKNTGRTLVEDIDIWEQAGTDLGERFVSGFDDATKEGKIQDAVDDVLKDLIDLADETQKDFQDAFSDLTIDIGTIKGDDLDAIMSRWNDFFSSTQNLTVDQVEEMQDTWEGFFGEFGEIVDEGLDRAWEIWRDYYANLADIDQKEQQDILDAQRDLQQDIQDLNRDTQQRLEDAARKYRENEIKAERDYQEKLRRLREEFLFDLEDALRERDALQVLRLIRRYNLDKEQLERQSDLEAEERAENYRQEIEDIRRQAARKLEELRIENQRRLQEIREQAAREREEAAIERDQGLQELKEDLERQRSERLIAYEQEKEDIRKRFEEQLAEITKGLLEQLGVTKENLDLISGIFAQVFGEDGSIAQTYKVFSSEMGNMNKVIENSVSLAQQQLDLLASLSESAAARISAAAASAVASAGMVISSLSAMQQVNQMPATNTSAATSSWTPSYAGGHAFGGSVYANTPTLAMFGEVPEIATFTPLSRLNTSNISPVGTAVGNGGSMKMKIQILLSPGLEAQIIDNSLGSMAEILREALAR